MEPVPPSPDYSAYSNSPHLHKFRSDSDASVETPHSRRSKASADYATPTTNATGALIIKNTRTRGGGRACVLVTSGILIAAAVLLVTALLLFFTLGPGPSPAPAPQALRTQRVFESRGESHSELVSPQFVLTAITAGQPRLCVLDALFGGSADAFLARHLPTAQHFELSAVLEDGAPETRFRLPHPLRFQDYARGLGISNDCHVVVYAHGKEASATAAATYIWWLFKLYGHQRVSVMSGGLEGWEALGFRLEDDAQTEPKPERGHFRAHWSPRWVVERSDFRSDSSIIDARGVSMFEGRAGHRLASARGSIDHAANIPSERFPLDISKAAAMDLLSSQRLDGGKAQLVYSNSGLGASRVVFALNSVGVNARLYQGGWIEWSHHI